MLQNVLIAPSHSIEMLVCSAISIAISSKSTCRLYCIG
jgi:hypothetical protein